MQTTILSLESSIVYSQHFTSPVLTTVPSEPVKVILKGHCECETWNEITFLPPGVTVPDKGMS